MKGDKAIQEAIKTLRLTIAINELLPPDLQCKRFIARMKVQLARLQRKPDLKLVITTNPKPVG